MNAKQWVCIAGLAAVAVVAAVFYPSAAHAKQISTKLYADASTPAASVGDVVYLRFQLIAAKDKTPVAGKALIVTVWDPKRRPVLHSGVTDDSGWATIPYKVGNPWPCRDGKPRGADTKSIRVKAEFADDADYNNSARTTTVRVNRPKKCR